MIPTLLRTALGITIWLFELAVVPGGVNSLLLGERVEKAYAASTVGGTNSSIAGGDSNTMPYSL